MILTPAVDKGRFTATALVKVVPGVLLWCQLAPLTTFFAGLTMGAGFLFKASEVIFSLAFHSPSLSLGSRWADSIRNASQIKPDIFPAQCSLSRWAAS
jgi:hypothetical protein